MVNSLGLLEPTLWRQQALIDGNWCKADHGGTIDVINPANGSVLGQVPDMGPSETKRAVDASAAALVTWRKTTARERSTLLRRWYDLMQMYRDDLARIMTLEQGKTLAEAAGEISYAASFIEWFSSEPQRLYGSILPPPSGNQRLFTIRQPIGVIGAITPWNFPAAMITRKIAPALAAGCTVVVKPSELTPYSALALAALAQQAGIPKGVINVVIGADPKPIGEVLCADPRVRMLTFTGSSEVGKFLMQACASQVKRLGLELGGNAPFIVFADADLDVAARAVMTSKFRNAGQTCVCTDRLLVERSIEQEFTQRLKTMIQDLRVGNGLDQGVTQGPLIGASVMEQTVSRIGQAVDKGAHLVCGGQPHALTKDSGGYFFQPTLLTGADHSMAVMGQENFAPVLAVQSFEGEDQAIELANLTPYGLASYLCSRDYARIIRVSEALEYGIVGVNEGIISTAVAPFGGVKESGLGREGGYNGIDEYLEEKYICLGQV